MSASVAADQIGVTIEFRSDEASDDMVSDGHLVARWTDLTVPGGVRLDAVSVTSWSRQPTDVDGRSEAVERLLSRARDTGHVVACAAPTDRPALGRDGFGLAADAVGIEVDGALALPLHRPAEGVVEPLETAEAAGSLPELYERCARVRVGTIGRTLDELHARLDTSIAVHRDSTGLVDGYVCFDHAGGRDGTVHELWGASDAIERALWGHVLSTDAVATWTAVRPVDEPLRFAVADAGAVRTGWRTDQLWIRLLDVDVALGARTYGGGSSAITIRVLDPMFGANTGMFRIDAYGSFRSQADPDIELGIEALSAVYLGGTSFRELHGAGRLHVRRSAAVREADALFEAERAPFCGA